MQLHEHLPTSGQNLSAFLEILLSEGQSKLPNLAHVEDSWQCTQQHIGQFRLSTHL